MWNKEDMNMVVKACCVIHDTGFEFRGKSHTGTTNVVCNDEEMEQIQSVDFKNVKCIELSFDQEMLWRENLDPIEDPGTIAYSKTHRAATYGA